MGFLVSDLIGHLDNEMNARNANQRVSKRVSYKGTRNALHKLQNVKTVTFDAIATVVSDHRFIKVYTQQRIYHQIMCPCVPSCRSIAGAN